MAILKEFRCLAHDHPFECLMDTDGIPECPFGCDPKYVAREFRTAPGIRHGGTSATDMLTRQLAADYGMTDMRGDKDGSSVMSNTPARSGGAKRFLPFQTAKWEPSIYAPASTPVYNHPSTLKGDPARSSDMLNFPKDMRSKTVFQKLK